MIPRTSRGWHAQLARFHAAERAAYAKTSEVLGAVLSEKSQRALLRGQRAAQRAMEEALRKSHDARGAREIALHLCGWFEEATFLVALQLDPARFSKEEIDAGVRGVLARVTDHVWEAARVAAHPLLCLEEENALGYDDDEDT